MKLARILSCVSFLALAGTLFAKDFWLERDYTKWDKKEVMKMLSDSPWAQTQSFVESMLFSGSTGRIMDSTGTTTQSTGSPLPGPSGPPSSSGSSGQLSGDHQTSLLYYVRFYSALPVRQAMVQMSVLNGREPSAASVDKFLNQPLFPDDIIIAVTTPPGQDRQEFESITADLIKNDTWIIKKNKERIQLRDYLSPSKTGGSEAYYLFPRMKDGKPSIDLSDVEIRFLSKLGKRELNRSFKLAKMTLDGKLVL